MATMNKPIQVLGTNDPFAVLGDLEIDLILSFFSVPETIAIRAVSTLWRARTDFRLTSAAIRRHYPWSKEANVVYQTKDEESLAFRRVAFRNETRAKPSMALIFPKTMEDVPWCICNDYMIWTDGSREYLYIKRVWDPKDPSRKTFRSNTLKLRRLPLEGKPRNGQQIKVQWMVGDDTSGILLLHIGVDSPRPGDAYTRRPRWALAISISSSKVIWSQKAPHSHLWNVDLVKHPGAHASLGHGNVCILDTLGNLAILDLASGQQKICKRIWDHTPPLSRFPVNRGYYQTHKLIAHPTMELCFAITRDPSGTKGTFTIFSTKTVEEVKSLQLHNYVPTQNWASTKIRFGKKPITEGGGERVWVFSDAKRNSLWHPDTTAVVTYEIDLQKFALVEVAIWNFVDPLRVVLGLLDPISEKGCICVSSPTNDRFEIKEVTFKRISRDILGGEVRTSTYRIQNHNYLTIPAKTLRNDDKAELEGDTNKLEARPQRRGFFFSNCPTYLGSYFSDQYMAFSTAKGIYLFGFMARW